MATPKPLPPIETLREVFSYCPDTGALTWRNNRLNQVRAGDIAGNVADGYVRVSLGPYQLKAHRVAWALHHGTDPGPLLIDHINRDKADNRASNLRLVDHKGNRSNSIDNSRPIQITYPDGHKKVFLSVTAASRVLGCSRVSVYRYALGQRQHPAGVRVIYL